MSLTRKEALNRPARVRYDAGLLRFAQGSG
jgi:hypothetical protein